MPRLMTACLLATTLACFTASGVAAAPVSTWKASLSMASGSVVVTTSPAGGGVLRVAAKHLTPRLRYAIAIYGGSCAAPGARLLSVPTATSAGDGTLSLVVSLTEAQAQKIVRTTTGANARLGAASRARCGTLNQSVPTNVRVGATARVPGDASIAPHLVTVRAVRQWRSVSDTVQLAPGNAFVTVLVRIEALGAIRFNSNTLRFRDASGVDSREILEGRDPALDYGRLDPGRAHEGWVTFEVPLGSAAGAHLLYPAGSAVVTFALGTPAVEVVL